jgi:hypothetical protein
MTRSFATRRSRRTQPMIVVTPIRRDPSITPLGFTCYRLVANTPIRLLATPNTMGVLALHNPAS